VVFDGSAASSIRQTVDRLIRGGLATHTDVVPATAEDIRRISEAARRPLPLDYLAFLRIGGKGIGRFMRGSNVYVPYILGLRGWAEELDAEDGLPGRLLEDDFVFFMHQGYTVNVLSGPHERPVVIGWEEGGQRRELVPSFADWFAAGAAEELAMSARIRGRATERRR
jgi:hypothetical protein